MQFVIEHSYLIPLLPLIGAIIAGLFGAKMLKGQSHWPIWAGVGASALMAIVLLLGMLGHSTPPIPGAPPAINHAIERMIPQTNHLQTYSSHWFNWIVAGDDSFQFKAAAGAFIDPLTAVMLAVVCGIGFLITVFAAGYMKGEAGYFRFFAYLGLFIFSMTCLVMGDNLIMLYLGWEGVGLCSYLLIGYYYDKPAAREAAKKAFIVNRIGDFGFAIGILLIFYCFGTVSYFGDGVGTGTGFIEMAMNGKFRTGIDLTLAAQLLSIIPFALMLGAFGKSAQFPLYVWLPDAMEGPTPVSALIHAATMVTAGVYMLTRLSTLFVGNHAAMVTIAVVGAFTAILAGSIALKQNDLKRVFAYSTVSQLGFMFVGVGVLNPVAAIFHLVTHAFFKALLFLSSGVVMHATGGELDLRKMSGMRKVLPITNVLILMGCLALSGFPLFSGFWSKDEIVHSAGSRSAVLYIVLLVTALFTAYYTFRLYFRVFQGPKHVPAPDEGQHDAEHDAAVQHTQHEHNHEPMLMILPLVVLALGAIFAGMINLPFNAGMPAHSLGHFLGQSPSFAYGYQVAEKAYGVGTVDTAGFGQIAHDTNAVGEFNVAPLVIGGVVALLGIGLAFFLHLANRKQGDALSHKLAGIGHALEQKYWVDEIYQWFIIEPLRLIGRLLGFIDRFVVDGVVFLAGLIPQLAGYALKFSTQRGYLQGYALSMMLGLAVILLWVLI